MDFQDPTFNALLFQSIFSKTSLNVTFYTSFSDLDHISRTH